MRIALFESNKDNQPKLLEVEWADLARHLQSHVRTACDHTAVKAKDCPAKFGKAWSPAEYAPGATRGKNGVVAITAAVFDLEGPEHQPLPDEAMARVALAVEGYAYVCHSTHSGRGFYRLIMPLSRPVTPLEWPAVWAGIIAALGLPADPTCGDPSRLYFLPSAQVGSWTLAEAGEGKVLDPDQILKNRGAPVGEAPRPSEVAGAVTPPASGGVFSGQAAAPAALSAPPSAGPAVSHPLSAAGPVSLDPLITALKKLRKADSREVGQRVISGQALGAPGTRDASIYFAAALCAKALPGTRDAAMMLLEPCIRAMDVEPEGIEHWLKKAAESYDRAAAERAASDAKEAAEKAALFALVGGDPKVSATPAPGEEWRTQLLYKNDRDGVPRIKANEANIKTVLTHDPAWKGCIRFNVLTKAIEATGPAAGVDIDALATEVAIWLQRSAYQFEVSPRAVADVLLAVAYANPYDPLLEYLESLTWDGVPRARQMLQTCLKAADTELNQAISEKFLLAAVARAYEPGCKADNYLILEGPYGVGKSKFVQALCGPKFFADAKLDVHAKDTSMLTSRYWMIELSELTGMSKADRNGLKRFMSTGTDAFRPPYGHAVKDFPRRCVFVGTTNDDDYLAEPNRREWVVAVGATNDAEVQATTRALRDQLWAEAVALYKAAGACPACSADARCVAHAWWLTGETAEAARAEASERETSSARQEQVATWLLSYAPEQRPDAVTVAQVAKHACGFADERITSVVLQEIGRAMKNAGFSKHRQRRAGALVWVYRLPESLQTAPKHAPARPMEMVEAANG